MKNPKRIEVLSKCRHFFKYMDLGLRSEHRIGRIKIPNVVSFVFFSIPVIVCTLMEFLETLTIGIVGFHENSIAFIILLACVQILLVYICLASKNKLIVETVDLIQEIVDRRIQLSSNVYKIYQRAEEKNTELGEAFGRYINLVIIIVLAPPILTPICHAIFHVPSPSQWQLPMPMTYSSLYFGTDTYLGFYAGVLLQSGPAYSYFYWFFSVLLFYISLCLFVNTFETDLIGIVTDLNSIHSEPYEGKLGKDRTSKIVLYLRDFVDLHNDMLKVTNQIRIIMSGPLFIWLTSCIIETVMELLSFDYMAQQRHVEFSIFQNIVAISSQMAMIYILCFFAEKYSTKSFQVTHLVYFDLLWFELPTRCQTSIVLPICRAQKLFRLTGFGIFDVTMEIYLKIIRSSISYFIIMRQLKT